MRKLFTFLLTMVVAIAASAAIKPTIQLGADYTGADIVGKTFAIVNRTDGKALYGTNNQNLAYGAFSDAFVSSNSGYLWKIQTAEGLNEGEYLLRLIKPDGSEYSIWGSPGYLNTQPNPGVSFILGLNNQNGQDCANGAVYKIAYVEGQGYSLQNLATGQYQGYNNSSAHVEEATYWSFVETISETYVPALKELLAEGENMKKNGASSAEYDAAIAGIDPETTADALADAQKVEAALPILAKTQKKAGSDFTRAIVNPFIDGNADGWTIERPVGGNGPMLGSTAFEYWAGNASDRAAASFDYWQEVTGIPNGTYTVGAYMYNDLNNEGGDYTEFAATSGVYATVGETTVSKLVDANGANYVYYETDGIEVTDGTLRVGVKNFSTPMAARWFSCDGFTLTLVKPAAAPAPEKEAWFTDNVFCYKDAANGVSRSMELPWVADPDDSENGCITLSSAADAGNDHDLQFMIRGAEYDGADLMKGAFAEGIGFNVSFKVKADGNYSGCAVGTFYSTVASGKDGWKFGAYTGEKLDVTTEWKTVSFTVIAGSGDAGKLTAIGFNLADNVDKKARTFYFDDVKITRGGSAWYVSNEFHAKDYQDPAATYADDQNNPHPVARYVADAEGGYVEVISNASAGETYNSQLWITIPEKYVGKTTKMTMEVMASKAITLPENFQATATGCGWGCSPQPGTGVVLPAGEWTTIERVLNTKDVKSNTWNSAWNGWQADQYCLDLSEKGGEAITYKFRNVKFDKAQQDWYTSGKIIAKDYVNGDEVYTNSDTEEFPLARYIYDDAGDYVEVQSNANRVDEWDSQIWIEIPEAWVGKKVKMTMDVQASKEVTAAAAYHSFAGGNHWGPGAGEGIPFKVGEWTSIERVLNTKEVTCNKGEQVKYYVLNLSNDEKGEGTGITYKFKNIAWSEAPVDAWADLIPLQDFEAGYTGADDEKLYFFEKEQEISSEAYRARIVEGKGKDGGNAIEFRYAENAEQGWYSQFEIRLPYLLPNGTKIRLTADIKAEKAASGMGGQVWYNDFGSYRGGIPGYALEADTWYTYDKEITINDGEANDDPKGLRFLVFDGKGGSEANVLYFDNISVQIPEDQVPEGEPDFLNAADFPIFVYVDPSTLDWTDNLFTNGDVEGEDMSAFIAKVNSDADALLLPAASQTFKGSNQVVVTTAAREADPEKEGSYLGNDHDTQFFVHLPYALAKGTKYYFSVDVISNKVVDVQSQTHAEPGQWKSNTGVGKISVSSDVKTVADYFVADNDMRTIAFNLASATEGGKFFFDNFVFKVVKDDEAAIKEFTATWDGTSTWNETFALNQAVDAGRTTEIEGKGYTAESVQALTDAIAAGKAQLNPAEGADPVTKETLAAAAKAIEDAIAGLTAGAPELAYTDLTPEMFFQWSATDETAVAVSTSPCDYNIATSTGQPYGLSTVNEDRFADLSAYSTIELTATEGEPRLLFNRLVAEGTVYAEVPRDKDKYETVVDNGDGSMTYIVDIAAIVAEYGFAHLHAIKGANWQNTTVNSIKLGYVGEAPEIPVPTNINGVEDGASVKDGKYFINGQIVIVKNGVKYNAAGVAIE